MMNRVTRAMATLAGLMLAGAGLTVTTAAPAAAGVEDCPEGYFCGWSNNTVTGPMWKTNKDVAYMGGWDNSIHAYVNRTNAVACLYDAAGYDTSKGSDWLEPASAEGYPYYENMNGTISSIRFVQDRHECDVPDYPSWMSSTHSPGPRDFGDMDGNGQADVISRDRAGRLWFTPGDSTGRLIGTGGWNAMNALTRHGDFTGDGHEDLIAREASTGRLWLYPGTGTGTGGLGSRTLIGTGGWNGMRNVTAYGDLTGDGRPDLIASEKSTGRLYLYPGTATGGLGTRKLIGTGGWNAMNALAGMGDTDGDGHPDLYAREASTGRLWLYPGTRTGGLGSRTLIGTGGWNTMGHLLAVGDFTGDTTPDLAAVTDDTYMIDGWLEGPGLLFAYTGRGDGRLESGRRVDDSWWGFTDVC
ncbi:VCBS repeat-containing protein [Streptomyces actuosus]|uniref:VCBS repeat-containing protein n=1 Tax=Streptomyces actuosus TaxID=1885 RepID=A0ABS2VZ60_STRAS|nr:FG-GAP-like repeat-containing protein [Streptomyces actuosus]MBN0048421.1 VCBS repeat-containing protein [Streptomyces actuosus]